MPDAYQAMFRTVRDSYAELADAQEKTVLANVEKAMNIGLDRAKQRLDDDLAQIRDDGLTGAEARDARDEAEARFAAAKRRHGWGKNARMSALRAQFESNRVPGPYFPLMRFGNYFVTIRDEEGKVISFDRFKSERKQMAFAAEQRRVEGQTVQAGVMDDSAMLKEQVDPTFVADIEEMVGDAINDPKVMDQIWQRWLETLPDYSIRKSRIHRKGTPGFSADAFRAFGHQMFHGSHQLARLTYALDMQKTIDDAKREADVTADPNRARLVVNEMDKRHQFAMNPTGSAWAQAASSAAFVYYLGVTPAAAMVNITQTTVVGIPILAAGFEKGSLYDSDGWPLDITDTEVICHLLHGADNGPVVTAMQIEKTYPEVGLYRATATIAETREWPVDVLFGLVSYRTEPGTWYRASLFKIYAARETGHAC